MNCFLLLDFGASNIKSAVVDLDTGFFSHILHNPTLPNCSKTTHHYEISPQKIKNQFHSLCKYYATTLKIPLDGIVLCSQMHGFILLDAHSNPITNYISWKDERSLIQHKGNSTFSLIEKECGLQFKQITGMRPRPGVPFMNVIHLARTSAIPTEFKCASLPEYLSLSCFEANQIVHETMLAGSGFYDIQKHSISEDLTGLFKKITKKRCVFNPPAPINHPSSYWKYDSKKIPIYNGVGDLQCAILGAGNLPEKTLSINIGTGSQVSIIGKAIIKKSFELRPFFDGHFLRTISYIPAGRALNEYLNFLDTVLKSYKSTPSDFWKRMNELTIKNITDSSLFFDLGLFQSAWNYKEGGAILNIKEGNFTIENYLASLLRCFSQQYLAAIGELDKKKKVKTFILSGGIPNKLPLLKTIFSKISHKTIQNPTPIDETLLGLRTLALSVNDSKQNIFSAQSIYGRKARVINIPRIK